MSRIVDVLRGNDKCHVGLVLTLGGEGWRRGWPFVVVFDQRGLPGSLHRIFHKIVIFQFCRTATSFPCILAPP